MPLLIRTSLVFFLNLLIFGISCRAEFIDSEIIINTYSTYTEDEILLLKISGDFDCPDLALNYGDVCDDGDPLTENDVVDESCSCIGEPCAGNCPLLGLFIGDSCDDDDDHTINDVVTCECLCEGTSIFCPELALFPFENCDDGNPETFYDTVTMDCQCIGYADTLFTGNSCFNPINIDVGTYTGMIVEGEGAINNCFFSGGGDPNNALWLVFDASLDGEVIITSGIDINLPDTRLSIYTGNCSSLTCLESDDDGGPNFTSYVQFTVQEDHSYFFVWDDRWSNSTFDFIITYAPLSVDLCDNDGVQYATDNCPCNNNPNQDDLDFDGQGDVCDEDIDGDGDDNDEDCDPYNSSIFLGASCDDGDEETTNDIVQSDCSCLGIYPPMNFDCFNAIEVFEGIQSAPGPNSGAMASNACFADGGTNSNWYFFTPEELTEVTITSEIDLNLTDTRLSVFQGACDSLACFSFDDDGGEQLTSKLNFIGQENVTYFIEWDDRWSIDPFEWILTTSIDTVDTDNDTFPDNIDNCPEIENPDQQDLDFDGIGNLCDDDIDGDGDLNEADCDPIDGEVYIGADCDDGDPETDGDAIQDDCSCEGIVGVSDIVNDVSLVEIFPNPAYHELSVSFKLKAVKEIEFLIFDISGRCVFQESLSPKNSGKIFHVLPIEALNQGVYFLRLGYDKNEITKKFNIIK